MSNIVRSLMTYLRNDLWKTCEKRHTKYLNILTILIYLTHLCIFFFRDVVLTKNDNLLNPKLLVRQTRRTRTLKSHKQPIRVTLLLSS